MTTNVYQPGDQVNLDFKDIKDGDGAAFSPPNVKFHVKAPGQDVVTVEHPDTSIIEVDTNWFRLVINVPYAQTSVGWWKVDAQGLNGEVSLLVENRSFQVESTGTLV